MNGLTAFYEPADFISWYKRSDILISLPDHVLTMFVNYMDGHDYVLASDAKNTLYQVDKAEDLYDVVSITDVLETVIGWNDGLIEHAQNLLSEDISQEEENSLTKYFLSLKKDECCLMEVWDSVVMWKGGRIA